MKNFWLLARIFAGAVFAYSGLSKLLEPPENFAAILSNYEMIPAFFIAPIAALLPWVEWLSGTLLILGYAPRQTAAILGALSFIFLMVLVSTFLTGSASRLDCGCFGESGIHLSRKQVFVLDLLSLAILIRLFFLKRYPWSLDALLKRTEDRGQRTEDRKKKREKK